VKLIIFALIPLILSIGIAPALQSDFLPEVDALKSQGTPSGNYGSATKFQVCGAMLCSEYPGGLEQFLEDKSQGSKLSVPEASELFADMVMFSKELNEGLLQEIILTNAHGANVAMSQRTTDYDQSDEEWWNLARDRGVFFGTPEFDESTQVNSWTMSLRITNSDNRFIGVIKFVVNDESKEKEIDSCESKPDVGMCKGNITRYYFDETSNSCQEFIWGGCGGVVPFDTLSRCQMLCNSEN